MKCTMKKLFTLFITVILFAFALCFSASAADKTAMPKKLKATPTTSSVTLKWSKVKDADYYRIYYKTSKDGKWKTAVKKTTKTKETLEKLPSGKKYYFAVRSFDKTKNGTVYSDMKEVRMATMPKRTTKITATPKIKQVKLNWKKVDGATHYRVYQKINDEWKSIAFTEKTSFTVKELKVATKYSFAVRAYVKSQSYTVAGAKKSVSVVTNSQVPNVTGLTFENLTKEVKVIDYDLYRADLGRYDEHYEYHRTNNIELKWKKIDNAKDYKVYIYENNQWKQIDNTKNTSSVIKDLTPGKAYKFAVKAYADIKGKTVYSSVYSTVVAAARPNKTNFKLTVKDKNVIISWDKVVCSGYTITIDQNNGVKSFYAGTDTIDVKNDKTSYTYAYPGYANGLTIVVVPYTETSKGKLTYEYELDDWEEGIDGEAKYIDVKPYATKTDGGIKIKPITSEEALKIYEDNYEFHCKKEMFFEGKSANGKTVVLYCYTRGEWSGIDARGIAYLGDGTPEICPGCGKYSSLNDGKNMCDGVGCYIFFGYSGDSA